MRGGVVRHEVRIFVTPEDLRRIADNVEKRWAEARGVGGADLMADFRIVDEQTIVKFFCDQGRMKR